MNLNEFKTMYSKREKHKTESVSLGKADIDVGIIPTINWLNSLKGVQTTHCCQGHPDERPYVTFRCDNLWSLGTILGALNEYINEREFSLSIYGLRFTIGFKSEKHLEVFQKHIKFMQEEFAPVEYPYQSELMEKIKKDPVPLYQNHPKRVRSSISSYMVKIKGNQYESHILSRSNFS